MSPGALQNTLRRSRKSHLAIYFTTKLSSFWVAGTKKNQAN